MLGRLAPRLELERIEVGQVMAKLAIGVDQPRDGRLALRRVEIDRRRRAGRGDLGLTHSLQRKLRHELSTEVGSFSQRS